jgi:hypothetical protein
MRNDGDPPTVEDLLKDPSTSSWMRNALITAIGRDPVDAANDAELLAQVLDHRCECILKRQN